MYLENEVLVSLTRWCKDERPNDLSERLLNWRVPYPKGPQNRCKVSRIIELHFIVVFTFLLWWEIRTRTGIQSSAISTFIASLGRMKDIWTAHVARCLRHGIFSHEGCLSSFNRAITLCICYCISVRFIIFGSCMGRQHLHIVNRSGPVLPS